jgi:hypothetical protein
MGRNDNDNDTTTSGITDIGAAVDVVYTIPPPAVIIPQFRHAGVLMRNSGVEVQVLMGRYGGLMYFSGTTRRTLTDDEKERVRQEPW